MRAVKRCHICGKPASIFLTQVVEGKTRDLALCEECARKKGIFDPRKLSLAEQFFPTELSGDIEQFLRTMIEESFSHREEEEEEQFAEADERTECPSCHYKLEDFQNTGLLGCPDCYKAFAAEFEDLGSNENLADTPAHEESEPSIAAQREHLEAMLKYAVQRENYEEAAKLRDQIRSLSSS